ncbi:MAG: OmpH family outer membrane protein [Bacteroidales bacterium]|nr:OmpH family outer membrane protein [Bacteroidales bacterium]
MKKIYLAAVFCFAALAANAQTFKFGNVDSDAIIEAMPERAQAVKEIEELSAKYESELTKLNEEFQTKYSAYMAERETLEKSIAEAREQELQQLQQRVQQFYENAGREVQTQQQTKMAPIVEKVRKAIQAVGDKNGFTYIFNTGTALYTSESQCIDCTPLVKAELGIK